MTAWYPSTSEGFRTDSRMKSKRASSAVVSDFRGHQALIEDFNDAIKNNRSPVCNGREGRRSLALVEAIYRAADRLRPQLLANA